MKKVMVGSRNAAKVKAVSDAVAAYWQGVEVVGEDVDSGVPGQPIGLEQTTEGAVNRAKAAWALGCDLGVGLEGGIMDMAGRTVLFGVVAVYDGVREAAVTTLGTPLPDSWGDAVKAGEELGPFMVRLFNDYTKKIGATPYLTNNVVIREETFCAAVKGALAPWVKPEAYAAAVQAAA